jgi:hypothetical protein
MAIVDFKITLPDKLRKEAEQAGLLTPKAMERLLREEIRRRRVEGFFTAADKLTALDSKPLTVDEIEAEIRASRTSRAS